MTEKNENFIDILGDTNRLEKEFFEGEEEESSFNLMAELTTIRNNILTTSKRRKWFDLILRIIFWIMNPFPKNTAKLDEEALQEQQLL